MAMCLDPAMLGGDFTNEDIYDLLQTTNNMIIEVLNIVKDKKALINHEMSPKDAQNDDIYNLSMDMKDKVLELKTSIENNKAFSRQDSKQGEKMPDRVTKFNLRPARPEDIKPLLNEPITKLGNGAFGDVFKVKYKGQIVALKHINKQSQKANQEMVHELKISHCYPADNIVPLYTYCEDPPCLVFQYMENGSLHKKLQDIRRPLTWKQRANIAVGIARGLYHLHENGVVHSDIKCLNILLDRHLEPKIADFGTNRLLYNMLGETVSKVNVPSMAGTPYYLPNWYVAHQQGKVVRKQIDVYSFGMVLLEIMSGKLQGDKWRDSSHRTLRDFVNKDIPNHCEPPTEYIAPVDDEKRRFVIHIKNEVTGETQACEVDWAKLMFDIGRQCTIHDQTPWREPLSDPEPWETMKKNNVTMERIFKVLEECYIYYLIKMGEYATNDESDDHDDHDDDDEVVSMGIRTARVVESGFVPNQNQSQKMDS